MRFARFALALSLFVSVAFAQSSSAPSKNLNTRLKPVPHAGGTVIVTMTGQFAATPSDSFTLQKQVFVGSTNCNCPSPPLCPPPTATGTITYVSNVSASANDLTSVTSGDSVRLQGFPGSDRNGQGGGFSNSDAATLTYLPGNAVCVQGFASGTHTIKASYSPGLQVLDATCTNPKFLFKPGDTVCVRATGTAATGGTPWHVSIFGGSINSCNSYPSLPAYPGTAITAETQTATFTLPASNAAIPGACTSNNTTDIRGNWQAYLLDQGNNNRGSDNFRVHDGNPSYDLSVYESVGDKNGGSNFPPAGYIKYSVSIQNNGPDAAPNASLVTSKPASASFISMTQTGGPQFTCGGIIGNNVTCTRSSLAPDAYASFEMIVQYSGQSNGAILSNTATASSSGTDYYNGNNTYTSPQTDVTISTNTLIAQYICPADITVNSTSASGAIVNYAALACTSTCTGSYQTFGGASGATFPIGTTIAGYQGIQSNGFCSFKITVNDGQRPDVTATKSHVGFFSRGQKGAQYTWTVKNAGGVPTNATVTLVDPLQIQAADMGSSYVHGLMPTSLSGSGWTCSLSTISCSRNDPLAGGASYPPITMSVNLARNGVYSFQNRSFVYGGGQTITTNDEADDQTTVTSPRVQVASNDYNADVKSDILWRNTSTGETLSWLMNASTITSSVGVYGGGNLNWTIAGVGDFNGDGNTDILWRENASGATLIFYLNNGTFLSAASVHPGGNLGWTIQSVADFNGDGKADILWRNTSTGETLLWLMNNATIASNFTVYPGGNTNWTISGVGDFNGDGNTDILWRENSTGATVIFFLNNGAFSSAASVHPGANLGWTIQSVADFDANGQADILWRETATGRTLFWSMNGATIGSSVAIHPGGNTNWTIVGAGDYNGDANADILWREGSTGQTLVWLMGPTGISSSASIHPGGNLVWAVVFTK